MKHFSLLLLSSTSAQIFMHSPRGSQNRIRERSAQNENENRLFWANHNNDYNRRGGYNTGEKTAQKQTSENDQYNMQYFMSGDNGGDSFLTVEWTQVNGCGVDPFATDSASTKTHDCSVLIQSLCQDDVTTPPKDIKDTYTIKNGFNYNTINFEDDGSNLADPKGGCFVDQGARDLEHFAGDIPGNRASSIEYCKDRCKDRGYVYAGLQYHHQCFCGNSFGKYGQDLSGNSCNKQCRDRQKNTCGGSWRNNIYLSGLKSPNTNLVSDETQPEKNVRRAKTNSDQLGIHESWESFDRCPNYLNEVANPGILPKRSGLECYHERQHFPNELDYSTQWTNVALFADDHDVKCQQLNLKRFQPIFECVEFYSKNKRKHKSKIDNQGDCEKNNGQWLGFYNYKEIVENVNTAAGCAQLDGDHVFGRPMDWKKLSEDKLADEACLKLPDEVQCFAPPNTRANYLGMASGTNESPRFQWSLPIYEKNQRCVLRIRSFIENKNEEQISHDNNDMSHLLGTPLYLATAQKYASNNRVVFEDRSHIFKLVNRPNEIPDNQVLHNIIVRGKRGNIVQTFPAVEYDFVPNNLQINNGDAVQFQWTGSNSHNNGNDAGDGQSGDAGNGQGGTDRHNMIQSYYMKTNFPLPYENHTLFQNAEFLWNVDNKPLSPFAASLSHATSGYYYTAAEYRAKQSKLNDRLNNADPSFRGVVFKPASDSKYYYVGMRNNDFSNRSQKGQLTVGQPEDNEEEIKKSLERVRPVSACDAYNK